MIGRFTLKELKSVLKYQFENYPLMYEGEDWVKDILNYDEAFDDRQVHTEWIPLGASNDGVIMQRISNFSFLDNDSQSS